jgi:hypothetical protein
MNRVLYLLLGVSIITQGCQTNSNLTTSDKESIVQAVKQASQGYWSNASSTYDIESYNKAIKFCDENSDNMWQTEPVAGIFNLGIINKQADSFANTKTMIENRISTPINIQKSHYAVLSDKKVLEVLEGDFSIIMKDSTKSGPFKWIGTSIWANVDGKWKMQFYHNSFKLQSE